MPRPTKIDRLPTTLRDLIDERRAGGATLDEIRAELRARGAEVGRTSIWQYLSRRGRRSAVAGELAALRRQVAAQQAALDGIEARVARIETLTNIGRTATNSC